MEALEDLCRLHPKAAKGLLVAGGNFLLRGGVTVIAGGALVSHEASRSLSAAIATASPNQVAPGASTALSPR